MNKTKEYVLFFKAISALVVAFFLIYLFEKFIIPHAPNGWTDMSEKEVILYMELISFFTLIGAFVLSHIMNITNIIVSSASGGTNYEKPGWKEIFYIFIALVGSLSIYLSANYILLTIEQIN